MATYVLVREQFLPRGVQEVFAFFADAGNLDAITPDWLSFSIVTPRPIAMSAGALIEYRLRWRGLPIRWTTRIEEWTPPVQFVDTQIRGPYRLWHHTHEFEAAAGGTRMRDIVRYQMPFGPVGAISHLLWVGRDVERIFDHRSARIGALLGR